MVVGGTILVRRRWSSSSSDKGAACSSDYLLPCPLYTLHFPQSVPTSLSLTRRSRALVLTLWVAGRLRSPLQIRPKRSVRFSSPGHLASSCWPTSSSTHPHPFSCSPCPALLSRHVCRTHHPIHHAPDLHFLSSIQVRSHTSSTWPPFPDLSAQADLSFSTTPLHLPRRFGIIPMCAVLLALSGLNVFVHEGSC